MILGTFSPVLFCQAEGVYNIRGNTAAMGVINAGTFKR